MLFYWSIICMFHNSSRIFIRYFWKKMAICINHVSSCICLPRLFNCINIDRIVCLYVPLWSIFPWKNDYWPKLCIWILNWKMDCLDIADRLSYSRFHSYFYRFILSMYFQKNLIFRTSSFIFCSFHDSYYKYSIPRISEIQLF